MIHVAIRHDHHESLSRRPSPRPLLPQRVYIVYEPAVGSLRVGIASGSENLTASMPGVQLVGGDLLPPPRSVLGPADCAARCLATAGCAAWSLNRSDTAAAT